MYKQAPNRQPHLVIKITVLALVLSISWATVAGVIYLGLWCLFRIFALFQG